MESDERLSNETTQVKVDITYRGTKTDGVIACEELRNENDHHQQQQLAEQNSHGPSEDETAVSPDLLNKLESVDLTDDDTELLLEEAYAMNKKLKEILRQQESKETAKHSSLRHSVPNISRSAGSKHAVLPPIGGGRAAKHNDIYSARLSRPVPWQRKSASPVKDKSPTSSRSSPSALHKGNRDTSPRRQKPLKSARSVGDKPMWNGRFSYT